MKMLMVQLKVDPAATRSPAQEGWDMVTWPWDAELAEVDELVEVEDPEVAVDTPEVVLKV